MSRVFLLAGESSGDLHGALLARALKARAPSLELFGVGGEEMRAAGVTMVLDSRELAVVGLLEVFAKLPVVLDAYERVHQSLAELKPDLFVPIDFPDFNFRLLPLARRLGLRALWYISPQVWAWRASRVEQLKRYVERVVVIFPFEEAFYRARNVPVSWVGHPLVEQLNPPSAEARASARVAAGLEPRGPVVALLPGSRRSEVTRMAPILADARTRIDRTRADQRKPAIQWVLGRASHVAQDWLRPLPGTGPMLEQSGRGALELADAAIAASGTVTMEAALLGVPTVVVYRTNPITFAIARRLVHVPHIAMANLILGRRLFPELLQDAARADLIERELARLLEDESVREEMRAGLREIKERLGPPGAADRAAEVVLATLAG